VPILVIHQRGRPPRREAPTTTLIRIGRGSKNDVVLEGPTVSRTHLTLAADPHGQWTAMCVSDKNPIVVDGETVTGGKRIAEGSEILVGKDHLVVFAQSGVKATEYMGQQGYFAKSTCDKCGWTGVVSTVRRDPVCLHCGGTTLRVETGAPKARADEPTRTMNAFEAEEDFYRLRNATRSALERVEKGDQPGERLDLAEDKVVVLGKGGSPLRGLAFGSVTIAWKGGAFVADSAMVFPAMRINGEKRSSGPLRKGDLLQIGSNRFRLVSK
jgi:hypothetical protein